MGLLAARLAGCRQIIAVDVLDDKLKLAKQLGATHVISISAVGSLREDLYVILVGLEPDESRCSSGSPVFRTKHAPSARFVSSDWRSAATDCGGRKPRTSKRASPSCERSTEE